MEKAAVVIVGAGAVGLAIAARLARPRRLLVVCEKNENIGQETSSRNSEVIHSGIYYPPGSLKARLSVRGNELLYDYLRRRGIDHRRTGKLVVAADEQELPLIAALAENGERNGAQDLELLDRARVLAREPSLDVAGALWSPHTGILDTHAFMQHLLADARAKGAVVACRSEVTAVEKTAEGFLVRIAGDREGIEARVLVNAAGLHADALAARAGIDIDAASYRLRYCKGTYFRARRRTGVGHLVYPVPESHSRSLGIHLTLDRAGNVRFGPDAEYVEGIDYTVDVRRREAFARAIRRYLPGITADDLVPDTAGIRPKLQGPGEGFRDFIIRDEAERGLGGLINLVGIESPGLTASLAIAEYIETLAATRLS